MTKKNVLDRVWMLLLLAVRCVAGFGLGFFLAKMIMYAIAN